MLPIASGGTLSNARSKCHSVWYNVLLEHSGKQMSPRSASEDTYFVTAVAFISCWRYRWIFQTDIIYGMNKLKFGSALMYLYLTEIALGEVVSDTIDVFTIPWSIGVRQDGEGCTIRSQSGCGQDVGSSFRKTSYSEDVSVIGSHDDQSVFLVGQVSGTLDGFG